MLRAAWDQSEMEAIDPAGCSEDTWSSTGILGAQDHLQALGLKPEVFREALILCSVPQN